MNEPLAYYVAGTQPPHKYGYVPRVTRSKETAELWAAHAGCEVVPLASLHELEKLRAALTKIEYAVRESYGVGDVHRSAVSALSAKGG